jgi:MFS family permease
MNRTLAIVLWTLAAGLVAWIVGAVIFGLLAHALASPGKRPHTWPGWDLLFFGSVIGLPLLAMARTFYKAIQGALPGTARRSKAQASGDGP